MTWTFKRVFYGRGEGLNLQAIRDFLYRGYYYIPHTLLEGYHRAVYRVGEHDSIYGRIEKPFPDALIAQKPQGKFALHLSGGFDSAILAKLYDGPDADFIHATGPESRKARALASELKGTLHEYTVTPEAFITAADELIPLMAEPYPFDDVVFSYLASKKAKQLGHNLIVAGDGGDSILGGFHIGPYSNKAVCAWKTIEPSRLLGLDTLQPFMHTALYAWSKATLGPREVGVDKMFARRYCKELGMPDEVISQRKGAWGGSLGITNTKAVTTHMKTVVDNSDYRWIREFRFPSKPRPDLLFRQYGLTKWLRVNYKERLDGAELSGLLEKVRALNKLTKRQIAREFAEQLRPPAVARVIRRFTYRRARRRTELEPQKIAPGRGA
ncbi:MAG: hypothetical protein JSU70_18075 [Phycisphaerales bacterium]|nr:MAG: hypothetical protein JSU70_18075 [Phycisphaerales bacterium]